MQQLFFLVFGWIWKAIQERKLPENWKALTLWTVLAVGSIAGASYYGLSVVMPPAPEPVFGWVKDPEAVKIVQAELPFKVFGDTPAGQNADPLPDHVYLWELYEKATGAKPPIKNQLDVGSCVSFGTNSAVLRSYVVEAHLKKRAIDVKDICEEATYGGSRVEIGGGRIRGDGSVGAWAAKFVKDYGVIPREVHGSYDLTKYSTTRCRQWGQSGVPDELEPIARKSPVEEITLVKTWAEAKKALASGYAIAVCSDQGFSMQRDSRGVAAAQGSWAHCMCLDGYHTEGGEEFGHIVNSWGPSAHTGPVGWGNPGTEGFWAKSSVVNRMLSQGDSWAFSSLKGWPKRDLDWFVRGENKEEPAYAAVSNKHGTLSRRIAPCVDFSLAP